MRKYTFQMTKEEVRELWSRVIWEQLRVRRFRWLLFLVILAVECMRGGRDGLSVALRLFFSAAAFGGLLCAIR